MTREKAGEWLIGASLVALLIGGVLGAGPGFFPCVLIPGAVGVWLRRD